MKQKLALAAVPGGRAPAILAGLGVAILLPGVAVAVNSNCQDLDGEVQLLGEARYATVDGTDTCWANLYPGGGSELTLPQYVVIGGAANSEDTELYFKVYAIHRDEADSDGGTAQFSFRVYYANSHGGGGNYCPAGSPLPYSTATYTVNSYNPGWGCTGYMACYAYGGKTLGLTAWPFHRYWKADLSASAPGGCSDSDNGVCWRVYDENECNLSDYPL